MSASGEDEDPGYARLMAAFDEACDLTVAGQAAYIEVLGRADASLAGALRSLLRHDRAAGGTLEAGASRVAAALRGEAAALAQAPTQALPVGEDLALSHPLGVGGMGVVWLARQRCLQREVAVKALRTETADSPLAQARLVEEAVVTGALEHPNIVPVHLLGQDPDGRPLLVMKRVEGVPWRALIADPEHPALARLPSAADSLAAHLGVLMSICNALDFAHSRGVLHLDVKPDNVMVGAFGEVYLVDWGVAASSMGAEGEPGAPGLVGTPRYMAPEMAGGSGGLGPWTDVYLAGGALHEVLTGRPPHGGADLEAILAAARAARPPSLGPEVSPELAEICRRALAADPAARFESARALREALAGFLSHREAAALAARAEARMETVRALVAERAAGRAIDAYALQTATAEALFGYHESLRSWPENPRAQAGLQAALVTLVRSELGEGNLERARGLLARIAAPPPDLVAEVEALAVAQAAQAEREARLRALDRGQDWSIRSASRAWYFVGLLAFALVGWGLCRIGLRPEDPIPPGRLLALNGTGSLLAAAGIWRERARLLTTWVSRVTVLGALATWGIVTYGQGIRLVPTGPMGEISGQDQLLLALALALGGVMVAPWLWACVPFYLVGALGARIWPTQASLVMAIASAFVLGVGLALVQRAGRRRPG